MSNDGVWLQVDTPMGLQGLASHVHLFHCVTRLRMDMYVKAEESASTKKAWTEQEVLLLLEVSGLQLF